MLGIAQAVTEPPTDGKQYQKMTTEVEIWLPSFCEKLKIGVSVVSRGDSGGLLSRKMILVFEIERQQNRQIMETKKTRTEK